MENSSTTREIKLKNIRLHTQVCLALGFVFTIGGLASAVFGIRAFWKTGALTLESLALLGTYLQGSAGVLWAFAGLVLIYVAFLGQREQLFRQEIEIEEQRKQFELQRADSLKHNKLSVAPDIIVRDSSGRNDQGFTFALDLCNYGIGPGRIKAFILSLDGKPFTASDEAHENRVEQLVAAKLKGKRDYVLTKSGCPDTGYCMPAGQTYRILEIFFSGVQMAEEKKCVEAIKGIRFRVEYESLYEQQFMYETKDHSLNV